MFSTLLHNLHLWFRKPEPQKFTAMSFIIPPKVTFEIYEVYIGEQKVPLTKPIRVGPSTKVNVSWIEYPTHD